MKRREEQQPLVGLRKDPVYGWWAYMVPNPEIEQYGDTRGAAVLALLFAEGLLYTPGLGDKTEPEKDNK